MQRLYALAPAILLAVYPLLSLFEHNQSEIQLGVLWLPLAICVASAVALYLVFMLVFKSATKAGSLAAVTVVAFFYYGLFFTGKWFLVPWVALLAALVFVLVRTRSELVNLMVILGVGAAVLVLLPVVKIGVYQAHHRPISVSDPRLWPTRLEAPTARAGARRPDVYVIIPDDYARLDVLKQYFHYDDAAFVRELTKRGFLISQQARSPYSDSEMNIAAELNMDYLSRLPTILGATSQDVRPVKKLIADNRAAQLLKPLGYRYVHLDTDEVTFPAGNPHISPFATPDSFPSLWLRQTLLRLVGGRLGFSDTAADERFRKTIRSGFSKLEAMPRDPGPKFVVFHTLVPHDPYIFGAQGQSVTFPDRSDEALGSKLGMSYYLQQLQFLNRKLLEAVDAILAQSKKPPVIVIQSDEGFQASPDTFGEAAMQQVRVKGLIALHLPGVAGARMPRPPNTVNTLRLVFNRYFGTDYPLLRSASYPELDLPYQFKEMRVK
jgi:hypothetical protein